MARQPSAADASGAAVPLLDGRRLLRSPGKRSQLIPCRSRGRLRMASATHFRRSDRRGWSAPGGSHRTKSAARNRCGRFPAARRSGELQGAVHRAMGPHRRHQASAGEGTSGPRRDAASRDRQFEKRTAGVPIGGGTDSPLTSELPVRPTDPRSAYGLPQPKPPS